MDFSELIAAADPSVFTESISAWISGISINSVIMMIMMIFMLVGAIDKICGNKLGYGEKFEEGFNAMGPLAMSMAGVVAAAPVLSMLLGPILKPIYGIFGASPAMFATTLLACDMGGYPLAMQLAEGDVAIGNFAGLILGTMMGPTIVFTIPVALGIIKKEDRGYLGAGVLAGLITVPIGCIVGGLMMNTLAPEYHLNFITIIQNLIPVIIIAALIVLGLWFAPGPMINGFNKFGTGVTIVITALTAIAVFEQITGIMFPVFHIMVENPADGSRGLDSGLLTCGQIAIVLIGAFPMVEWITRTFGKPLEKIGAALGMNEQGSAGMVANLANNIAMFNIMGEMNPKGKLLNVAFAVSAAFVFGDHLGFTAGNNPDMIFPVIVGKLVAGVTAIIVANILAPKLLAKIENVKF
ncbi:MULTISPECIES: ethanolamine utilization protein EutH [Intestinimonas]|jgi:ethanolamine transporter|uniref:Ethanolamine transporter n=2 Tax=Intestinimonas TaxID=1392389 RepID=A0A2U1BJD6_9FIRM|nr:ethanolamine utilization protein EutH [Intestinimonas butyriciproducens]SCJ83509.1 ethanolamine utilization protein EutH [uncultured Clostridium sp.]MBU5231047.1 ethanolamine utilization protein EutH [Intestinimonas butyriciproducens]MCI6363340.1 ethanolamine utilization protein EutH [Intestinimonas butyriciproducens]MCR1906976.1 ethanolamine utilization protein EutH [Intestinimonas butyriciproducens]MDB7818214.1 ethanolamine utilization protein EutH [Intestinimonas butyriciproducens]